MYSIIEILFFIVLNHIRIVETRGPSIGGNRVAEDRIFKYTQIYGLWKDQSE